MNTALSLVILLVLYLLGLAASVSLAVQFGHL